MHIEGRTSIGRNIRIGNGCTLGHAPPQIGHVGAPTGFVIGDVCFIMGHSRVAGDRHVMKHLDEYRDPAAAAGLLAAISAAATRPWRIMEVCGGQTHTIVKEGLDRLLPSRIELIHGPGCPVCVTPPSPLDAAFELALRPGTVLCAFGDMMRVPGPRGDLLSARARGGDVRMVYSPLDALALAKRNPGLQVVFFAIGFETTAPANAMALWRAAREGVPNFSLLTSQVRVPPALEYLLSRPECGVDAVLAAGHVCVVMGEEEYHPLALRFRRPIVTAGFEAIDILRGILAAVRQLEAGRFEVENAYTRAVHPEGNRAARELVREVFEPADCEWRGLGVIPLSGMKIREAHASFDAATRFGLAEGAAATAADAAECRAGLVLQGRMKPSECPAFGVRCTPENPLGAPMVSAEGACSAYHRHGRLAAAADSAGSPARNPL